MAKALMAGFHRIVHRVRPAPVGSRLRVTRYRHAAVLQIDQDAHPEFRAFPAGAGPQPQDVLAAVHGDPDRRVEWPVRDLTVADLRSILSRTVTTRARPLRHVALRPSWRRHRQPLRLRVAGRGRRVVDRNRLAHRRELRTGGRDRRVKRLTAQPPDGIPRPTSARATGSVILGTCASTGVPDTRQRVETRRPCPTGSSRPTMTSETPTDRRGVVNHNPAEPEGFQISFQPGDGYAVPPDGRRRSPRRRLDVVLALVVVVAVVALDNRGPDGDTVPGPALRVLTMANAYAGLDYEPAVAGFVTRLEEISGGRLTVELINEFGDAVGVNAERQVIDAVRAGTIDLGWVGTRVFDTLGVRSFQALTAPMLIDSYALQ
jgi:hypothetical protein